MHFFGLKSYIIFVSWNLASPWKLITARIALKDRVAVYLCNGKKEKTGWPQGELSQQWEPHWMSAHPGENVFMWLLRFTIHLMARNQSVRTPTGSITTCSSYWIRSTYEVAWTEKSDKYTGLFLNFCNRMRGNMTSMNLGVLLSAANVHSFFHLEKEHLIQIAYVI